MALNASGPISLAGTTAGESIQIENGGNGTTEISLNDAAVRTLAGVPSGVIIMPTDFYGKSNRVNISFTYSVSTQEASLNLSSISGYSSGTSDITVNVNSAIYLWSNSTATPALNITGGTTGDTLTIVNNGYIMGKGGTGGSNSNGFAGGTAINFGFGLAGATINNTNGSAFIGGGGGGGGGSNASGSAVGGGGGAGGANGGAGHTGPGGPGGGIGASGSAPNPDSGFGAAGGGGRIFPGTASSTASFTAHGGQAGGRGGNNNPGGGGGGGSNNAGSPTNFGNGGGGGGGWGASGGGGAGRSAGGGGKAINLNGKTATFTSGDTARVWGAVS
jgi:hypothetical protein